MSCTRLASSSRTAIFSCSGVRSSAAAWSLRLAGVKHVEVAFVESFCRVESLSLTGRIMYWVAHRFFVHWPELARRYPRAEYLGRIC